MKTIIEIVPLPNGAHRNQTSNIATVPEGWAVIPDNIETPNFPFGEITASEIDGVMTVTSWTAGVMPEPEPEPEPVPTQLDKIEAQVLYTATLTDTLIEEDE